jgi:hypothetical protein
MQQQQEEYACCQAWAIIDIIKFNMSIMIMKLNNYWLLPGLG